MTRLSICIPTYNRASLLAECIGALVPQVAPHAIPICVSDNGSTDDTRSVVAHFRENVYPLIEYTGSEANDRIDRNILRAVSMATTEYAWIFGDDDRVAAGAVDAVLNQLESGPAVVYVNRSEWMTDMSRVIRERTLPLRQNRMIDDPDVLLGEFAAYITFVGALVVNVARWRAIDPEAYLDTDFVHVGIVHEYFAAGDRAIVLAEPLIDCRLGNATWSDRYFDVWFVNWRLTLERLPSRYTSAARRRALRAILDGSITTLLSARAVRKYGPREYQEIIVPLYEAGDRHRTLAAAVSWTPVLVARLVTSAQRRVRRWLRARSLRPARPV